MYVVLTDENGNPNMDENSNPITIQGIDPSGLQCRSFLQSQEERSVGQGRIKQVRPSLTKKQK